MARWRNKSARVARVARVPRGAAVVAYSAIGAWLVPWSAILAARGPSTAVARHWNLAWSGLDLGEAWAAGATAWLLVRRDRRAAQSAAVLAALLCADAWLDVCTAGPGRAVRVALAEAALLELPIAAASAWLSARVPEGWSAAVGSEAGGAWSLAETGMSSGDRHPHPDHPHPDHPHPDHPIRS